jgi:hypothetical protein
MWMSVGQKYEITIRGFAHLLGLEHQLEMPPETRIHTFGVLKLDEMQFMYALGADAHPPKVLNFMPAPFTDFSVQLWLPGLETPPLVLSTS